MVQAYEPPDSMVQDPKAATLTARAFASCASLSESRMREIRHVLVR